MDRLEELVKNVDGKTAMVVAGAGYIGYKLLFSSERKINSPTIGPGGIWGAYSNLYNGRFALQEGYDKFNPTSGSFKVPMVDRWNIIVTGKNVEELRHAPEDVLSFHDAAGDGIAIDYTMGPAMRGNMFHVSIIKNQLTRNLPALLPDVMDEIMIGFEQEINAKLLSGDEWTKIKARTIIPQIVSRASNRILVGLPMCRIQAYLDLNVEFAMSVIGTATFINLFPKILRPVVGWSVSRTHKVISKMLGFLGPIIEERKKLQPEERPNDFLTWVINELEVRELDPNLTEKTKRETNTPYFMALMVLSTNFAAIHTSSMSFTQALYWLAADPDSYLKSLREEVEEVVEKHGWTKQSLVKMRKLDSFMRESQRISGLGGTVMGRKAIKDYTFSDGTFVPAGHVVSTPLTAAHNDPARYEDPGTFKGFRFANMRSGDGDGSKWQMVATSPDYLPFGHGIHACPGRFFAANELKLMMAQLILHYDIKLEGGRPQDEWFGAACIPNREGEVMFRRRKF